MVFMVGDELVAKYRKMGSNVRSITCSCLTKCKLAPLESVVPTREEEVLHLLYVGQLAPEEGLSSLIRAVASVHRAHVRLHLNVVGGGVGGVSH